jgi:hypothetical protein
MICASVVFSLLALRLPTIDGKRVQRKTTRRVGLRVVARFQLAGTSAGIGTARCHLVGVGFWYWSYKESPVILLLAAASSLSHFLSAIAVPQNRQYHSGAARN